MSKYNETSFSDPKELKQKVDAYFDHCKNSKQIYELKNGDIKIRQQFPTMPGCMAELFKGYTVFLYQPGSQAG